MRTKMKSVLYFDEIFLDLKSDIFRMPQFCKKCFLAASSSSMNHKFTHSQTYTHTHIHTYTHTDIHTLSSVCLQWPPIESPYSPSPQGLLLTPPDSPWLPLNPLDSPWLPITHLDPLTPFGSPSFPLTSLNSSWVPLTWYILIDIER